MSFRDQHRISLSHHFGMIPVVALPAPPPFINIEFQFSCCILLLSHAMKLLAILLSRQISSWILHALKDNLSPIIPKKWILAVQILFFSALLVFVVCLSFLVDLSFSAHYYFSGEVVLLMRLHAIQVCSLPLSTLSLHQHQDHPTQPWSCSRFRLVKCK